MLGLRNYRRNNPGERNNLFERTFAVDSNVDFVIWKFIHEPQSIEFGYVFGPISSWIQYCYDQPLDWMNLYANLSNLTDAVSIAQYVYNTNCSLKEFAEIIKTQGSKHLCRYYSSIKLKRRIKRIPEYKMIADAWLITNRISDEQNMAWHKNTQLWLDLLNFLQVVKK